MKISRKLVSSFVGISLLTGFVGAVAVIESQKIAETLAIKEAENVAQTISVALAPDDKHGTSSSFEHIDDLRADVSRIHQLQKRDVAVVDRQKRIVADAIPEEVGTIFSNDQGNEIQQTIQDSNTRTFLEKSVDYPQGIKQIVVPLKTTENKVYGAIILEWSVLYDDTIAQARPIIIVIGITSLGCLILALFLGLTISRSIANPIQALTEVAQRVTQESNFDLQAPVTTHDETGFLATALNHLIQRVKVLLNEKEERTQELQNTLNQLRNTQLQLVQTEKMSSLGQLVAGVAHEINNPVNFIYGNITHLDSYTQDLLKVVQAYQTHCPKPPEALRLERVWEVSGNKKGAKKLPKV